MHSSEAAAERQLDTTAKEPTITNILSSIPQNETQLKRGQTTQPGEIPIAGSYVHRRVDTLRESQRRMPKRLVPRGDPNQNFCTRAKQTRPFQRTLATSEQTEPTSTVGRAYGSTSPCHHSPPKKRNRHSSDTKQLYQGRCRMTFRNCVNPITANRPCITSVQVEPDFPTLTFTLNTRSLALCDMEISKFQADWSNIWRSK